MALAAQAGVRHIQCSCITSHTYKQRIYKERHQEESAQLCTFSHTELPLQIRLSKGGRTFHSTQNAGSLVYLRMSYILEVFAVHYVVEKSHVLNHDLAQNIYSPFFSLGWTLTNYVSGEKGVFHKLSSANYTITFSVIRNYVQHRVIRSTVYE